MNQSFCISCGNPTQKIIPPDDDRLRAVCPSCGQVHYTNPKMVVGCIPEWNGEILLCKRNIEPRKGFWTLPAGYLESNESVQDGAVRETREETRAEVKIIEPYRLYNITFVDQMYLMFRAKLVTDNFGPTKESTEVRLFKENEIPWDDIAFKVIYQTLEDFFQDRVNNRFPFGIFDLK